MELLHLEETHAKWKLTQQSHLGSPDMAWQDQLQGQL